MAKVILFENKEKYRRRNPMYFLNRVNQYLTIIQKTDDDCLNIWYTDFYKNKNKYYGRSVKFSKEETEKLKEKILANSEHKIRSLKDNKYENRKGFRTVYRMSYVETVDQFLTRVQQNDDGSIDIFYTDLYKPSKRHYGRCIRLNKNQRDILKGILSN